MSAACARVRRRGFGTLALFGWAGCGRMWFGASIRSAAMFAFLLAFWPGCRAETFDRSSCRCLLQYPGARDSWAELGLRRCVARSAGDGNASSSELQCRTWLTSPWMRDPPVDDVAHRVWPQHPEFAGHYGRYSTLFDDRWPWLEDLNDNNFPTLDDGDDGSASLAVAAVRAEVARQCSQLPAADCRHQLIAALVKLVRRDSNQQTLAAAEAYGLHLFVVIRATNQLDLASVGHDWWSLAPVPQPLLPQPLADEVPRVDVGALLAEVRWLQTINHQVFVTLAPEDGVVARDLWAVLWALDNQLSPGSPKRHWSGDHTSETPPDELLAVSDTDDFVVSDERWPNAHDRVRVGDINWFSNLSWSEKIGLARP